MADLTTQLSYFLADLLAGFIGTSASTGYRAASGTAAAPSFAFTAQTGLGIYRQSANVIGFANDAYSTTPNAVLSTAGLTLAGTAQNFGFAPAADAATSADTKISRAGVGVLNVANGTSTLTAEVQVSGGSGGFISPVKALTELTTIAAAATTTTAIQLPANAVILAVSVRVVTIIPTAATFTVTSATPAKTWNTVAVAVAAGTTDQGTAPGPTFQTTASVITFTPNLTPGTATGQVRVTVYYYQVTPATS